MNRVSTCCEAAFRVHPPAFRADRGTTCYYVCEACGEATDTKRAPDAEGEGGFPEGRRVEGYGDKYLVCEDGRVFRLLDDGNYETVAPFDDPPRVTLYRLGKRWRPRVATLVERCFGEKQ